jgi:hypothetical protein
MDQLPAPPLSELTLEELQQMIRRIVRQELHQSDEKPAMPLQMALVELTPLRVGGWPELRPLVSRNEYYGDEYRQPPHTSLTKSRV